MSVGRGLREAGESVVWILLLLALLHGLVMIRCAKVRDCLKLL